MNPMKENESHPHIGSAYFNILEELCKPDYSLKDKENHISKLFAEHSESIVADLLFDRSNVRRFNLICQNLKQIEKPAELLLTVEQIKTAALHLKQRDIRGLTQPRIPVESNNTITPIFIQNLTKYKLPDDLEKIRGISEPHLKAYVLAAVINKDEVPITNLNLTKSELMLIAPHLTYLDCSDVFGDAWSAEEIHTFLDSCSRLKSFKINTDKITRLMPLRYCKYFNCSGCSNLRALPNLPSCKELSCADCVLLESLPELASCKKLFCYGCSSLRNLPNLPNCTKLECVNCIELREIPELPHCKKLNCSGCSNLIRLHGLPVCNTLDCIRCTALQELPPMSECTLLLCSGCTNLERLPLLPSCEALSYDDCPALDLGSIPLGFISDINEFTGGAAHTVSIAELEEDPLGVLLKLQRPLIEQRIVPQIRFVEADGRIAEGLDAGGVLRIFISRLMQSLISHSNESKQLDFIETETGLHLPIFNLAKDHKVQLEAFELLGAIFELCYTRSFTQQYVTTGMLFDQKLFETITSFSHDDLDALDLKSPDLNESIKTKLIYSFADSSIKKILRLLFLPANELNLEQYHMLREIVLVNMDEEEKLPLDIQNNQLQGQEFDELKKWVHAWVKDFFLGQENNVEKWVPALVITKQMHRLIGSEEGWGKLCRLGAKELDLTIQGGVDKELIWSSISWETESRNLDPSKVEKTQSFVKQWIEEASFKDLQNLSNFIAGSPSINPSKNLFFHLYDTPASRLPTTHSCTFVIELPINYPEYKDFKEKLELALANVNSLESSNLEII